METACEVKRLSVDNSSKKFCYEVQQRNGADAGMSFGAKGRGAGQPPIQDLFLFHYGPWEGDPLVLHHLDSPARMCPDVLSQEVAKAGEPQAGREVGVLPSLAAVSTPCL